ncbi:MAG: hypothetical protein ACLUI7_06485 [Coprococcus sp.]
MTKAPAATGQLIALADWMHERWLYDGTGTEDGSACQKVAKEVKGHASLQTEGRGGLRKPEEIGTRVMWEGCMSNRVGLQISINDKINPSNQRYQRGDLAGVQESCETET